MARFILGIDTEASRDITALSKVRMIFVQLFLNC